MDVWNLTELGGGAGELPSGSVAARVARCEVTPPANVLLLLLLPKHWHRVTPQRLCMEPQSSPQAHSPSPIGRVWVKCPCQLPWAGFLGSKAHRLEVPQTEEGCSKCPGQLDSLTRALQPLLQLPQKQCRICVLRKCLGNCHVKSQRVLRTSEVALGCSGVVLLQRRGEEVGREQGLGPQQSTCFTECQGGLRPTCPLACSSRGLL